MLAVLTSSPCVPCFQLINCNIFQQYWKLQTIFFLEILLNKLGRWVSYSNRWDLSPKNSSTLIIIIIKETSCFCLTRFLIWNIFRFTMEMRFETIMFSFYTFSYVIDIVDKISVRMLPDSRSAFSVRTVRTGSHQTAWECPFLCPTEGMQSNRQCT